MSECLPPFHERNNTPVHVGVWLSDLIPGHLHTLGFFDDPKREALSHTVMQSIRNSANNIWFISEDYTD